MRNITMAAGAAVVMMATQASPAAAQTSNPISAYMTMEVCTATNAPTAPSLPGVVPGDVGCQYTRQIMPGELPPYQLRNFATTVVLGAQPSCTGAYGELVRVNVPVTIGGQTRYTTYSWTNTPNECTPASLLGPAPGTLGLSVDNVDATSGYASNMGSWSPVAVSLNDTLQYFPSGPASGLPKTPVCAGTDPFSSTRFDNGWVLSQGPVPTLTPTAAAWETSLTNVITPAQYAALTTAAPCTSGFQAGFNIWKSDYYMFYSGRTLQAVITAHYSGANASYNGPGDAQQMERNYFTREFGLSRWEKWSRSDLVVAGTTPKAESILLLQHGTCTAAGRTAGTPYNFVTNPADSKASGDATSSSDAGIYQKITASDGTVYTWFLTLCDDYTNIDRSPMTAALPSIPSSYTMLWTP